MRDALDTVLGPANGERGERELRIREWNEIRGALRSDLYDEKWRRVIDAFYRRFDERFLGPAQAILDRDEGKIAEGSGFAVLALDCLLLESLYGYRMGRHTNVGATSSAFERILLEEPFRKEFESKGRAAAFARAVRNGILHDGETRDGWIVAQALRDGLPMLEERDRMTVIYREVFHEGVKAYLTAYFASLKEEGSLATALRENFRCRVNELCDDSAPRGVATAPIAVTKSAVAAKTVAALGLPEVDAALARLPEAFALIAPFEQRVGYKAWKVPGKTRTSWMQWNDGDARLPICFPDQHGEVKTWKLFARFADGVRLRGPWERPAEYERKKAQWMLAGPDVWGLSYEAVQEFLHHVEDLESVLRDDICESYRYACERYGPQ